MLMRSVACALRFADNAVNGVPACADKEVMTTLMRQTWNFTGSVVSVITAANRMLYPVG